MGKFYVQCGNRNVIVNAIDSEAAAMHLMDLAMSPQVWIYDDAGLSDGERHAHLAIEALLTLAPEIRVSEQGINRTDAIFLGTPEVLTLWHQTMVSLSKLFRSAGLVPKGLRAANGPRGGADSAISA